MSQSPIILTSFVDTIQVTPHFSEDQLNEMLAAVGLDPITSTTSTINEHPNATRPGSENLAAAPSVSSLSCLPSFVQSIVSWIVWIVTCGRWNLASDSIDNSQQEVPAASSRQPQETTAPIENTSPIETPSSQLVINKNSALLNLIGFIKTCSAEQDEKAESFIQGPAASGNLSSKTQSLVDQLKQSPLKDIPALATEFDIKLSPTRLALALLQLLGDREPKVINGQIFTELSSLSIDLSPTVTAPQIHAVKSIIQKMAQEDRMLLKEVVDLFSSFPMDKWAHILFANLPVLIQQPLNESELSEEQGAPIVWALTIMMMHSNEVFTP